MTAFIIVFAVAVVLWAVISLIVLLSVQAKKQAAQADALDAAPVASASALQEAEEPSAHVVRYLPEPTPSEALTWQQQLDQLPGVLGWILVRSDGQVVDSSDEDCEEMGVTLSKMLGSLGAMSEDLGVTPLQLIEWEGPQGSVLVAFPKNADLQTFLVLFLDTETYKNQMRDILSQLNWEANLKGDATV